MELCGAEASGKSSAMLHFALQALTNCVNHKEMDVAFCRFRLAESDHDVCHVLWAILVMHSGQGEVDRAWLT